MRRLFWRIEDWLQERCHRFVLKWVWGPRCPDFDGNCPTCQHWAEHDEIFS